MFGASAISQLLMSVILHYYTTTTYTYGMCVFWIGGGDREERSEDVG
jgi:hypothetical protein